MNNDKFKNLSYFFDYFKTQWFKKCDIRDWNISELTKKCLENNKIDKLFFTNNIMESLNSRMNYKLNKYKKENVNLFNNKINEIINQ